MSQPNKYPWEGNVMVPFEGVNKRLIYDELLSYALLHGMKISSVSANFNQLQGLGFCYQGKLFNWHLGVEEITAEEFKAYCRAYAGVEEAAEEELEEYF